MNPVRYAAAAPLPPASTPAPAPAGSAYASLRGRTVRGGALTALGQGLKVFANLGSTVLLARLLTPVDYGLVAMVTGFTCVIEVFKDGGLSLATVQRDRISDAQVSTLFWLNVALGGLLMLVTFAAAPFVTRFFAEPRLGPIMLCFGGAFLLGGLGVQHTALLRRHLRFGLLALIDVGSFVLGAATAVALALRGFGYWALVAMIIVTAAAGSAAAWLAVSWRPARCAPLRDVWPLIGFGGNVVATRLVYQLVRGSPSVLIGWCWGPAIVGLYQRAYALLMFAIDQVQGPIAAVVLPPLSRLQREPARMKHVFLTGYRLIVSVVVPVLTTSAVFSEELVALLLGAQWSATAAIFRWLAIGGVMIALLYPQGMLLLAMGRAGTCMKLGLADAIGVVLGYLAGLHAGALGVAIGFVCAKCVLAVPITLATFRGTPVSWREVLRVVRVPVLAAAASAMGGVAIKLLAGAWLDARLLAVPGCAATLAIYAVIVLVGARQWPFYRGLLAELRPQPAAAPTDPSFPC
jgi:PST family polysaccharide transporter